MVKTAQAYRPHVMDMFEPQDHPQDFEYPGGPPVRPYDSTGYTLAFQMGVKFDRVLDGFDGPFERLKGEATPPPGKVVGTGKAGWLVGHETNNSFVLTNRLLKAKAKASWLKAPTEAGGKSFGAGAIWVPYSSAAAAVIAKSVGELGIDAYALPAAPKGESMALKPVRIGLVDVYGGSMTSGWTRWLYEQFEFPFTVIYPQRLDAGNLKRDFDVVVLTDEEYESAARGAREVRQPKAEDIPPEFRGWLGSITDEKTAPQLDAFVNAGGALITVGSSNYLAGALKTPVTDALMAPDSAGKPAPLPGTKFYIPGAVLGADVDTTSPLAFGVPAKVDVFYDNSPAFTVPPGAAGVKRVAWYGSPHVLRSGWAWGQEHLNGAAAVLDVDHGKGKIFMLMPEVTQRGQSHGAFKFMFNGLYYGPAAARP